MDKNVIDFVYWPCDLLNSLISTSCFIFNSFGFYTYTNILSMNKKHFTHSFPIVMKCIYFSCLIVLAKIYSTMLNRSGEMDILPIFWILGGKHSYFTLKYNVNSQIFIVICYHIEETPFYSYFAEVFFVCFLISWVGIGFHQMLFLHLWRWSYFFSSFSLNVVNYVDLFSSVKLAFILETILSHDIFFIHFWIWFANVLLRVLAMMFMRDISL